MAKLEITAEQQKTEDLFAAFLATDGWNTSTQVVANIFRAHHTCAFSCAQLEKIACALYGYDTISLQLSLDTLVKAKALRSRANRGGSRLYEVKY